MLGKKMLKISLATLGTTLPVFAFAFATPDLHVHNNTNLYSTVKINNGRCSSEIGEVTGPGEKDHVIKGMTVFGACGGSKTCKADVFMTAACGSPSEAIATVIFDSTNGTLVSNTPGPNRAHSLAASGLDFTLS